VFVQSRTGAVRKDGMSVEAAPLVGVYQSRDGFGYVRTRKGDNYGEGILFCVFNLVQTCILIVIFP